MLAVHSTNLHHNLLRSLGARQQTLPFQTLFRLGNHTSLCHCLTARLRGPADPAHLSSPGQPWCPETSCKCCKRHTSLIFIMLRLCKFEIHRQAVSIGFTWQGFRTGRIAGVASVRRHQKLLPCQIEPVPVGSKMDPLLAKAEPISNAVIMYLRKSEKCCTEAV